MCRAQFGKFLMFLSFRFYVKSIFVVSRRAKSAILPHLDALNFDFYKFLHFLKNENDQINKNQST